MVHCLAPSDICKNHHFETDPQKNLTTAGNKFLEHFQMTVQISIDKNGPKTFPLPLRPIKTDLLFIIIIQFLLLSFVFVICTIFCGKTINFN